jgi:predicted Zn-dependent protease
MRFVVSPGRRGRHLAAAAAACLALGAAGCVTDSTGLGLRLVPEEQVVAMGQQSWEQLRQQEPASKNAAYQRTAKEVAGRLLTAGGRNPAEWEVVVFASQEVNAFALPNRKIGVYEGMMKLVAGEAELAAVIGHEIGHVDENHAAERLNSQAATEIGISLAGLALGSASHTDPQAVASLLGMGAQFGLLLPYSRNQELEADRLGLTSMAKAGYDPRAAVTLWQKMQAQGGRSPVFMSTHPGPEQRIERLQALMPKALEIYRQRGAAG